jgi:hypothetical protein
VTFDDFCRQHRVTASERIDLGFYLAFVRMRATLKAVLP